jgi:hypothetical protein
MTNLRCFEVDVPAPSASQAGFAYPETLIRAERHRSAALTRLITVVVLTASLAVIASTVRFGIGRQDVSKDAGQGVTTTTLWPDAPQAISKRPNSTSRPGAASNRARV